MDQLLYLRKEYGDVFVTELPDGQSVPWRLLSIGEYLKYESMFAMGQYPTAYIEDEIFRICVLDSVLVKSIGKLKAGEVSLIAGNIWTYSAPQSINEHNYLLNANRVRVAQLLPSLVKIVCIAFPAYKPEDVEAMNYQDLMYRVGQAEDKMLHTGFLQEPLVFDNVEQTDQPQISQQERLAKNKNMINEYYEQQGVQIPESIKEAPPTPAPKQRERITDHPDIVPVPKYDGKQVIITKADMAEHDMMMTGHEQDVVSKMKCRDETAAVYTDYLDQLREDGKLKIQTPEERKAAAEARMEVNKQKVLDQRKETLDKIKGEIPELLKVREEARKRKARKAAKRRK